MRTKDNIRENFLSAKFCKDEKEYFEKYSPIDIDYTIKEKFKQCIYNLPSIFEILTNPELFQNFSNSNDFKDLKEMKIMMLERYIKLLKDFGKKKIEMWNELDKNLRKEETDNPSSQTVYDEYMEEYMEFVDIFLKKVENYYQCGRISLESRNLAEKIDDYLYYKKKYGLEKEFEQDFNLMTSFANKLPITKEGKVLLIEYLLSGDNSKYVYQFRSWTRLKHVPTYGILLPCVHMAIGTIGRIFIKNGAFATVKMSMRGGSRYVIRHGWKSGLLLTGVLAIAEVGINAVVAKLKSGFIDGIIIFSIND